MSGAVGALAVDGCTCDGSGWIVVLDRDRYSAPATAEMLRIERCACHDGDKSASTHVLRVVVVGADTRRARRLRAALERDEVSVAVVATVADLVATPEAAYDVVVFYWRSHASAASDVVPALHTLRERFPTSRVLGVTGDTRPRVAAGALSAGVDGLVGEADARPSLWLAVRAVHAGFLVLPGGLGARLVEPPLTLRERQVLARAVERCESGDIATELELAESTIRSHLSSAFGKLGIRAKNETGGVALSS